MQETNTFLCQSSNIDVIEDSLKTVKYEHIDLKKNSVIIHTNGYFESVIIITYDEELLNKLTQSYFDCDTLDKEEKKQFRQSAAAEVANTIVGKSLLSPNDKDIIIITTPKIINDKNALSQSECPRMLVAEFKTKFGNIQVYCNK